MANEKKYCCICGKPLEGFGNNPDGAVWKTPDGETQFPEFEANDRCCDICDSRYVIPGRLYRLTLMKEETKAK